MIEPKRNSFCFFAFVDENLHHISNFRIFFDETQCCILAWTGCWRQGECRRQGECTGISWSPDSYIGSCGPLVVKHQKTNQITHTQVAVAVAVAVTMCTHCPDGHHSNKPKSKE